MPDVGHNSLAQLKGYSERINNLLDQIEKAKETYVTPLRSDIATIYAEAKAAGFDKKALKEVVRSLRLDHETRALSRLYEDRILEQLL